MTQTIQDIGNVVDHFGLDDIGWERVVSLAKPTLCLIYSATTSTHMIVFTIYMAFSISKQISLVDIRLILCSLCAVCFIVGEAVILVLVPILVELHCPKVYTSMTKKQPIVSSTS